MKALTFLLVLVVTNINFSQILTRQEIDEIDDAVVSNCGSQYAVSTIIPFDRIEKTSQQDGFEIEDTDALKDCFVFIAYTHFPEDEFNTYGLIGIYKNGSIIWKSDPVIKWETLTQTSVPGIMDLNRDGVIDIIILCYSGQSGQLADIWILSWDGNTGWFINGIDEKGYSVMSQGDAYGISIVDTNGDGLLEICMGDECYYWNGTSYSSSEPYPAIVPKDKLIAKVTCITTKTFDSYKYEYTIKNDISSVQKIVSFGLNNYSENLNNFSAPEYWQFSIWGNSNFLLGHVEPPIWNYTNALINPANESEGFSFSGVGLPIITSIYIQGYNTNPDFEIEKIKTNSFITNTLSSSDLLLTINNDDLIDTLINFNTDSFDLGWITNQATADKYDSLFNLAKSQFQQNNNNSAKTTLQTVLQQVDLDSTSNFTSEAYALLRYNTEYLLDQIPQSSPNLTVNLKNSAGILLTGGSLQYYEGGWKDAVNNGDGTFSVVTNLSSVSLRMTYEYGSQTVSNVSAQNNTYTFQTVNASVQLQNSTGNLIDEGTVKYYAGAWRNFGTTVNGVTTKELLPNNYSFRMTYAYANNDKQQNIGTNSTVIFQTVNALVQLQNSTGDLIDEGTVQYYAGAWRSFGATQNGIVTKELLPINYSFRMTYEYGSNDKQQNIGTNSTVIFQTVNATVQLQNSTGNLIDEGVVKYYAGAWRDFGTTVNGVTTKELLPNNYSFRMTYEFVSNDKQQDLNSNSTVTFSTVLCTVKVSDANNQPLEDADTKYYSGAWRDIGLTNAAGIITKEILPKNLSFRAIYNSITQDKQQDIGTISLVEILLNVGQ